MEAAKNSIGSLDFAAEIRNCYCAFSLCFSAPDFIFTPTLYIYVAHIRISLSKLQYVLHNQHHKDPEPSPESFQWRRLYVCSGGLTFWNFTKTPPIHSASLLNFGGLGALFGRLSPQKPPVATGLQESLSKEMGYTPKILIDNVSAKLSWRVLAILRKSWEMIITDNICILLN